MIFVPVRSEWLDSKAYGTAAIVVANFAVALLFACVDPLFSLFEPSDALEDLVLRYGEFNPVTWVTSAFVHGDFLHLAGNMLFLLTFGMIVEASIGWLRFLCLYVGIAAVSGALEQSLFLSYEGHSYGASGCVFGLIAMAWLWSPNHKVTVFWWVMRWVGTTQVTVGGLALWWIGWEVLLATAFSFGLSTPVLHLIGAGCGFVAGYLMLRTGKVDTGGEDWLAMRAAMRERARKAGPFEPPPVPKLHWRDHLESWIQYFLPILAGSMIAVGFIVVQTMDWADPDLRNTRIVQTVLAVGLMLSGVLVFSYWRQRN